MVTSSTRPSTAPPTTPTELPLTGPAALAKVAIVGSAFVLVGLLILLIGANWAERHEDD